MFYFKFLRNIPEIWHALRRDDDVFEISIGSIVTLPLSSISSRQNKHYLAQMSYADFLGSLNRHNRKDAMSLRINETFNLFRFFGHTLARALKIEHIRKDCA